MDCSSCAARPPTVSANTGRDEYLPSGTHDGLTCLGLGKDEDLEECPTCGALYLYVQETSWTGSGNNDYESLTRLPAAREAIVRACLHRGEVDVDVAARVEDDLFGLPRTELDLVLAHVYAHDRALVRKFLPRMVADLARSQDIWSRNKLTGFAYGSASDAAFVLALIEATPHETSNYPLMQVVTTCREKIAKG